MSNETAVKANKTVRVGLLGLGTVGSGVMKVLLHQQALIKERTGYRIEVPHILVRDPKKKRKVKVFPEQLTTDADRIVDDQDISIVIEVMGGVEPARTILLKALRSGKHVITANKELLAKHGSELMKAAQESGVQLLFEASVAGGIPVIRFLQGYLTANRVYEISGILNGTTNYILTKMEQTGQTFAEALAEAQELGYAEADPTDDVEGYDAAYKLAILTNLAFDVEVPVSDIFREGIKEIRPIDLGWAREFGYVIKLLARSRKTERGIELSVGPCLLPLSHPLARVHDVFNAVTVYSDVVGDVTLVGKGAGEYPTASAVIEDLTALLRQSGQVLRTTCWQTSSHRCLETESSRFFIRFTSAEQESQQLEQQLKRVIAEWGGRVIHQVKKEALGKENFGWIVQNLPRKRLIELLDQASANGLLSQQPLVLPCLDQVATQSRKLASAI
ncbi:homoserine dehydrogenase [Thermoflavimicrobium dichotomicum]|uniref:Homoserine dehydrogenase n=1 Tax=Thermoflavimicrobium dichotomicum TaxID=46223 RepID=A0A1I3SHK6_9BACL|nr:homoserine dehydrogenase [Thermoflavimicrobium dichotomicum]SFJ58165.1 homoserine dehydrogenase [Thermoflavimicrobium dichotomicum]